jgi:hypothetical protein
MKSTIVKRAGGLALAISATEQAEMLLLDLFLAQIQSPRRPLWASSCGSTHGNRGEVVERTVNIDVAGADVVFGPAGATIEAQLVTYATLIEQRWRVLSDGERLTLMEMCCRGCGALDPKCYCQRDPERD